MAAIGPVASGTFERAAKLLRDLSDRVEGLTAARSGDGELREALITIMDEAEQQGFDPEIEQKLMNLAASIRDR